MHESLKYHCCKADVVGVARKTRTCTLCVQLYNINIIELNIF